MLSWPHFVTVSDMSRRQSRETQRLEHRLVVLLASPPAFGLWIRALFERSAIRMPNCFVCKNRCPGRNAREREELPGFNGQNPSRFCHDMCWESVKDVSFELADH